MITEVSHANGATVSIYPDDSFRSRREYYGKDEDVVANGDGTFKITVPHPARDADIFCTKDTKRVFMYDEDIDAWWEQ